MVVVCYGGEIRVRDGVRVGETKREGAEEHRGRHSAALQWQSQQMLLLGEVGSLFTVEILSARYLQVLPV